MTSKSLLLAIPGLPITLQELFPNPRLMALAGVLTSERHETQVTDLGTVDTLERIYNEHMRVAVAECFETFRESTSRYERLWARLQARQLDRHISDAMTRLLARTAKQAAGERHDFILFDIADERSWGATRLVMDAVRRLRPATPLFACGPFAEAFHDVLFDYAPALDGIILADAEVAVAEIAARVHAPDQWRFVPNFRYRNQHAQALHRDFIQDLATLAAPACDSDVYPALHGGSKLLLMPIEDARGSVFPAHSRVQAAGPPLRTHAAPAIARLMQRLGETTKTYAFSFANAEAPASLLRAVAAELVGRSIRALYSRPCHVQCMDAPTAAAIAVSGAQCVRFRLDSGSQRLLEDHYGHTYGVSDAERSIEATTRQSIHTTVHLTYPCPWDDAHTEQETLRIIRRIRPHGIHVDYPKVYPHTRWHTLASQFGYNHSEPCVAAWLRGRTTDRGFSMSLRPPVPFGFGYGAGSGVQRLRAEFERALAGAGAACPVTMEGAMVARVCGFIGRESSFCRELDRLVASGDAEALGDIVRRFNERASAAGRLDMRSFVSSQMAVGN